jgi:tetratricopeptide (TPR) repeat protein
VTKALSLICLLFSGFVAPVRAQNAGDMINIFGQIMRAALVDHARHEWSRISPRETSCVERALEQHGDSIGRLVQIGVVPSAPGVAAIRQACRTTMASPPTSDVNSLQLQPLSSKPTFDCAKAQTVVARIICSGEAGAKADWEINSAYWAMYFSLPEESRDQFDQDQQHWIWGLSEACRIALREPTPAQTQCVLAAYHDRAAKYRSRLRGDALAESRLTPEQHVAIQQGLIERGLLNDTADGEFGPNTRIAIKQLQSQSGLLQRGFLNAPQRQQFIGATADVTPTEESDVNERASHLSVKEADDQCRSSDPKTRLVGCTAIIKTKARGSYFSLSDALDGRCGAYDDLAQYQQATRDCRDAITAAPERPYAYNNLGRALLGLGDFPNAIAAFSNSIERKSNLAYAYLGRAKAYKQSGKDELATKDYETILAIDPNNQEAKDALNQKEETTSTQPPSPSKETEIITGGKNFLEDVQQFIGKQQAVPTITQIAQEAAALQIALNAFDEAALQRSKQKLNDLLQAIPGFSDFEAEREKARQREQARRLVEAKASGEKNVFFVDEYMKLHLGDSKTASLLDIRGRIDRSARTGSIDDIVQANKTLQTFVEKNELKGEYESILEKFERPLPPPAPKSPRERFGFSDDETKVLLEGPSDDILLFYNISPTAPHVWRNVRGDIVFQDDTAALCIAEPNPDLERERFVEHLLRDNGVKTVTSMARPCNLARADAEADIIAVQRGELLKQRDDYIVAFAKNIESHAFRQYQIITDYPNLYKERRALALEIERGVETGKRQGYGLIAVGEIPIACVVPGAGNKDVVGLNELLNRNEDVIAPRLTSTWQIIETSSDLAFRGLQRRQCGYVASDAGTLKTIMTALRREPQLTYAFAPVWWEQKDLDQAAFDVRDKAVQEQKKKEQADQERKDQEALENERARNKQMEKTEIERKMRAQNGVRARGLMNEIGEFVSELAEKRRMDKDRMLPNYSNWLDERFEEGWETFNVTSEVQDFGELKWQNRILDGIIVKTNVQQKNRVLGKYETRCFTFGLIDDVEFQMKRDRFAVPCNDVAFINSWKIGKDFHSGWNAE